MTNLEGRVILREAAMAPPPGVRTDLQVMGELAQRLGRTGDHDEATSPAVTLGDVAVPLVADVEFSVVHRAGSTGPAMRTVLAVASIRAAHPGVAGPAKSRSVSGFAPPERIAGDQ
jgi:hypothetical protein